MVDVAYRVLRFLHIESCGQCNPCKVGTGDIAAGLEDLVRRGVDDQDAFAVLARRVTTVTDSSRCYLPSQAQLLLTSLLQRFPADVEERLSRPGDPMDPLPKIVDLSDGEVDVDAMHDRKKPDWTYAETPVWLSTS